MKKLYILLLFVIFNASEARVFRHEKNNVYKAKNTQICFNDVPSTFGTTHFIMGYHENHKNNVPKKENKKLTSRKKQNSVCELIDCNRVSQPFFTTKHNLSPILLEVMGNAKKCLYIAAFSLTDPRIVDCIIDAYNKGIDVWVLTDANNMKQSHSKIDFLVSKNVPVWYYKPKKNGLFDPCMHHKFMIVDNEMVITGSANLTKAGQRINAENINILRDQATIKDYLEERERLKPSSVKCLSQQNDTKKE
jgi:phosphatidylserine/phosphatidylglycerophosphate/cardiolipin synthase-like enzyme